MKHVILKQEQYAIEQRQGEDGRWGTVLFDSRSDIVLAGCSMDFRCPVRGCVHALRVGDALNR